MHKKYFSAESAVYIWSVIKGNSAIDYNETEKHLLQVPSIPKGY